MRGDRLGELFVINDEFEKKLHPEARKVFHNWNADIQRQVQLTELNDDDLNYLSYDDKIRLKRILEIPSYLNRCVDIKDGDKLYDVYFGDIFFSKGVISQLRRDLLYIEFDIGLPPKKESSCNVRLELKIKGVNHGQEIAFSRGDYQQVARS